MTEADISYTPALHRVINIFYIFVFRRATVNA